MFYAKVHRLLQDSGEGIPYVQRVYKRSAHFRAQFHECKGFCYQRLLCKCRELRRGEGYGTRVRWIEENRLDADHAFAPYVSRLRTPEVFRFCAIPQVMAIA